MNPRQVAALQMEENPLQKALDNYQELERQWHEARIEADSVRATNAALVSEIAMLRESYRASEADRVRWQATAATLLGRLYAINDVIGGAVRAAARDGLEAITPAKEPEKEPGEAEGAAAAATQCVGTEEFNKVAPEPEASPAPPQAAPAPTLPPVDFGGPRQAVAEFRR